MWVRATYNDGFVLNEDERDESSYVPGANVFSDIHHGRPCAEHGVLVEFALITLEQKYAIDWTAIPEGARPVRERHMEMTQIGDVLSDPTVVGITFGYEYEVAGEAVREVIEVAP